MCRELLSSNVNLTSRYVEQRLYVNVNVAQLSPAIGGADELDFKMTKVTRVRSEDT